MCFDYRPAVVTPLDPTNTRRLLPGRAAMYTPVQAHVKQSRRAIRRLRRLHWN